MGDVSLVVGSILNWLLLSFLGGWDLYVRGGRLTLRGSAGFLASGANAPPDSKKNRISSRPLAIYPHASAKGRSGPRRPLIVKLSPFGVGLTA